MLENLFVWNADVSEKISAMVTPATFEDLKQTADWQTQWTSREAQEMLIRLYCAVEMMKSCWG